MNLNIFKKKSANNDVETANVDWGCSQINVENSTRPSDLIRHNKHFVYACTKKIEQYISAVPIHSYYYTNNPEKMLTEHMQLKSYIKKDINIHSKKRTKSLDVVEITDINHPMVEFIQSPAEGYSYSDWISLIASYIILTGNALLEIIEENGQLKELKPLKWECATPYLDKYGNIDYYSYNPPSEPFRNLKPENVIHIKNFAPGNMITGKGNLEAAIDSSALYSYYDAYQTAMARNYATPAVHVKVQNKVANKDEAQSMAQEFMRKFGKQNTGKPIVTFGDVDVTPIGQNAKDMEFSKGRDWAKKVICACLGVPEDLVDVQDSNRASSTTAITQFIQITIYPLLNKIMESINSQVTSRFFHEDAYYYYDNQEILDKDVAQQATVLNSYVASGIMTIDEARQILEMEPKEVQDVQAEGSASAEGDVNEDQV